MREKIDKKLYPEAGDDDAIRKREGNFFLNMADLISFVSFKFNFCRR